MSTPRNLVCLLLAALIGGTSAGHAAGQSLEQGFANPPASARPWVYWFWLNGNITREGITADLEAMQRVGIGGVLIMEVDQGMPTGPVDFMSEQWRSLFKFVCTEADRLGLEVNMNDCAGWNGSSGPWITPELSMQQLTWTETRVPGGQRFEGVLERPKVVAGFYRDVCVRAFPTPADDRHRINHFEDRALGIGNKHPERRRAPDEPIRDVPDATIQLKGVIDLTEKMDAQGKLTWDAPAGPWTVMRFGHTSTGADGRPAPASGNGLECDKLSTAGSEAAFNGMMGKLITDVGPRAGKTLVRTHIDSWENGTQNWTALMPGEFRRRRGYDMRPYLPVMAGRLVGSAEISRRFLWDLRQTISELVVEHYAGHMRALANRHGLGLSIEAYDGPCDDLPYAGQADEPMSEFWIGGMRLDFAKSMASSAHVYGRTIVGAEAFTANNHERWLEHPATIKALGDQAFCGGVNRFVFHRYAMQPWVGEHAAPGMMMGPWGLHYERTNTWWRQSRPWHEYLSRCQFMLRRGRFVADVCYLQAQDPPQGVRPRPRRGYDYDVCAADAVMTMRVEDGRLVLPGGMSYRVLVLPDADAMTPPLLAKIVELVQDGATVIGSPPKQSPSLSDYPRCDQQVQELASELWADCDGKDVTEHAYGRGRVCRGVAVEDVLAKLGDGPDFVGDQGVDWIHRREGNRDSYFVANTTPSAMNASCRFRVADGQPQLWDPETGRIEPAAVFERQAGATTVSLRLEPSQSVFVVFSPNAAPFDPVVKLTRDDEPVTAGGAPRIVIQSARYGVLDDPARTRDVKLKVQAMVETGRNTFQVAEMANGDDPAHGVVKTLEVTYTVSGKPRHASGTDPQSVSLNSAASPPPVAILRQIPRGALELEAWRAGRYQITTASGKTLTCQVKDLAAPVRIEGPWSVHFPTGWGAPPEVTFEKLTSWSDRPEDGVRYFSGTAVYLRTIHIAPELLDEGRHVALDLGEVKVMARVKLNGHDLGLVWKPPYRLDVTDAVTAGDNDLVIEVTNLWPNRLIGDKHLPDDSERRANGTLERWPQWLLDGKPSPTGRYTFSAWRLWKADDSLIPSGLIGPVQLIPSVVTSWSADGKP
jgi:(4-O-methyl)-D-glucuronate---lignin esterase